MRRKQHSLSGLLAAFLFVAAMMLPASVWAQSVTTEQPTAGDGTSANPYQIANVAQLAWFSDWVNGTYTPAGGGKGTKHETACAKLTADIDMSSVCSGTIGSWKPIGNWDLYVNWSGTFDGDGHTLSNLYVNRTTEYVGMFGYTTGCTIKNITFSGVNITGTEDYTGIIGYMINGSVTNVTVTDGVITGESVVGGICAKTDGTISHCTNHAQVTGSYGVGGICGKSDGTIEYCTNYGAVTGTGNYNSSIGGIVGGAQNGGSISHCANYGNVEGDSEVGGILGSGGYGTFSLANVISTGNVTETSSDNTPGMVVGCVKGQLTLSDFAVFNSDATLNLNGTAQTARGIGKIDSSAFYNGSVSGETAGYTTDQLQSGMVTYLLQSAAPDGTWGQQLGTDDYPLLGSAHTVYAEGSISILCTGAISGGSFSNTQPATEGTVTFRQHGTITHHAAVEKTCTQDGHVEYWYCDLCHMYYTDAKLTTVIADPVLHATGHNYNYTTGSCTVCGEVIPIITEGTHTIQIAAVSGGPLQINGYNLYRFVAPGNGDLTVTTTGSADTYGSLWKGDGKTQLTTDDEAGKDSNFQFTYAVTKGTVYYIGVRLRSGAALDGDYTITLSGTWPPYVEALTLADGEAYTTAQNALNFTYTRNFAHTQWQPLYVPFAMKSADWTAQGLEVACINNFHEYEQADGSTKVVLEVKKVTTGMLRPNTPYLIRAIEAGNKTITLSYVELAEPANNTIDCASVTRTYTFTGIYAEKSDFNAANDYTMTAGDLYHPAGALKPQRWYLSVAPRGTIIDNEPGSASPRVISVSVIGEGEATGIDEIGIISHTTASDHSGLYDLQGRRLNHEPVHGIYIHNGRKVVR